MTTGVRRDDLERPNPARIYDYALGGDANFTADRAAFDALSAVYPDTALAARANRAFLRRAVTCLAQEGIDQFLDIGAGLPTAGNVHTLAQTMNPLARVIYGTPKYLHIPALGVKQDDAVSLDGLVFRRPYVDNDPVAVRYSRQLLDRDGVPHAAAIEADLRDPAAILAHPRARHLLDLSRPIALILAAVLHFIPDDDAALGAMRDLTAALPVGSYMVISHGTDDGASPETLAQFTRLYAASTHPVGFRSRAQLARFFDGFEVIEPGIVFTPTWHPDGSPSPFAAEPERAAVLAGVGRKL